MTASDRAVYEHVTERDPLCRACGERGTDHRHHLEGRKITSLETVVGVCARCHEWLHVRVGGKRLAMRGNAEERDDTGRLCGLTVSWRCADRWITEPEGR